MSGAEDRRAQVLPPRYASRWRAETVLAEPRNAMEPTDEALRECFAMCAVVPPPAWYPAIRAEIERQSTPTQGVLDLEALG